MPCLPCLRLGCCRRCWRPGKGQAGGIKHCITLCCLPLFLTPLLLDFPSRMLLLLLFLFLLAGGQDVFTLTLRVGQHLLQRRVRSCNGNFLHRAGPGPPEKEEGRRQHDGKESASGSHTGGWSAGAWGPCTTHLLGGWGAARHLAAAAPQKLGVGRPASLLLLLLADRQADGRAKGVCLLGQRRQQRLILLVAAAAAAVGAVGGGALHAHLCQARTATEEGWQH